MKTLFLFICLFCLSLVRSQEMTCDTIYDFEKSNSADCLQKGVNQKITLPKSKFVHIDFDKKAICQTTKENVQTLLESGYKEIQSDFHKSGFSIYVLIRWKAFKFRFDINSTDAFSMEFNENIPFFKETHLSEEGKSVRHIYNNKWISVNKINYSSAITISENSDTTVGMGFIKAFNWIIDRQNRKVYIKKNAVPMATENQHAKSYKAGVENGKLLIISRNARFRKYHIGNEIVSVNNVAVSSQNICEMLHFLSETPDWNTIDIRIGQD